MKLFAKLILSTALWFAVILALLTMITEAFANDRYAPPPSTPPGYHQPVASPCEQAVKLAIDVYAASVWDSQYPNMAIIHDQIRFMRQPPNAERPHKAADYIAGRLRVAGVRKPWYGIIFEAGREFMQKECK